MDEINLTDEMLPNLCRLCLQSDDFIVDIFHNLDPNPNKEPLPDRIYDLYQVKVAKSDSLPTNICHTCLYYTETFSEFRSTVRKCEARLQNYVASLGILGSVQSPANNDGIKQEISDEPIEDYSETMPDENSLVTVVDPNQECDDSEDDSFSMDSDNGYSATTSYSEKPAAENNNNNNNGAASMNGTDDKIGGQQLFADGPDSAEKNVFLCQYCDAAFTVQYDCTLHENTHDSTNPFSCMYCIFKCASRQVLVAHIKDIHDNDRPYVCVQCQKGFGRRSDLKKHTIVHTGVRPFTCPVCNKNFSRNTNLTKHLRIHTGLKPHVCQKCPRSFTTIADLIRHQKVHSDGRPYQCPKCPSAFTRKDKLMHHERTHLRKEQQAAAGSGLVTNSGGEAHQLTACGSQQSAEGFDTENMVISLDPYTDVNQSEAANANNMSVDSQQNTPKKQQQQPPQQQQLTPGTPGNQPVGQEGLTQDHVTGDVVLNINSSDDYNNVYSCDYCPQKFSLFSALIHHNSTHNSMQGHVCPICSKRFVRKRELQRHSVIHTGLKPYACRFCNKRFNRKDKVVRHERIHADEKFSCTQCELSFSKQEALDMHLKVHELNKDASQQHQQHQEQQFNHLQQQLMQPPHNPYYQQQHAGIPGAGMDPNSLFPMMPNVFMPGFLPQMNFYNELRSED